MKKRKNKVRKAIAKLTLAVAKNGAGLASSVGWHQPSVPQRLTKGYTRSN